MAMVLSSPHILTGQSQKWFPRRLEALERDQHVEIARAFLAQLNQWLVLT